MVLKRLYVYFFCLFPFCSFIQAEGIYTKSDSLIYASYMERFGTEKGQPIASLFINTAKFFLNKPYVTSTLDVLDEEKLVVNLREFDCVTLVESCLALALTVKSENSSFENFCKELISIRYRGGSIHGYHSRLHYTLDWIYENEKRNVIENITSNGGGVVMPKNINFMSSHANLYKQLKKNTSNIKKIKEIEGDINSRNNYAVISITDIAKAEAKIKTGDIIAFSTDIEGLDYSHMGIAYWKKDILHFIHASSKAKKVVIEEKSLSAYCKAIKNCSGISVLRIK